MQTVTLSQQKAARKKYCDYLQGLEIFWTHSLLNEMQHLAVSGCVQFYNSTQYRSPHQIFEGIALWHKKWVRTLKTHVLTYWLDVIICTCCCECISSLWSTIITEQSVLTSPTLATRGVHLQQQASGHPVSLVNHMNIMCSLSPSHTQTNRYRSKNQCCHPFSTLRSSLPSSNTVQCSRAVWSKTSRWDTLLTRVARMMHMLELLRNTGRRRTCLRGCVSEREVECSNLMWKLSSFLSPNWVHTLFTVSRCKYRFNFHILFCK